MVRQPGRPVEAWAKHPARVLPAGFEATVVEEGQRLPAHRPAADRQERQVCQQPNSVEKFPVRRQTRYALPGRTPMADLAVGARAGEASQSRWARCYRSTFD